jgi:hypothetical protein
VCYVFKFVKRLLVNVKADNHHNKILVAPLFISMRKMDRILIFSIEIVKLEVLFHFFEQNFDTPALFIKKCNIFSCCTNVKQKISNCFRTFRGAEMYARIEGFISTARKNDRCVFKELASTFEGHNLIKL